MCLGLHLYDVWFLVPLDLAFNWYQWFIYHKKCHYNVCWLLEYLHQLFLFLQGNVLIMPIFVLHVVNFLAPNSLYDKQDILYTYYGKLVIRMLFWCEYLRVFHSSEKLPDFEKSARSIFVGMHWFNPLMLNVQKWSDKL